MPGLYVRYKRGPDLVWFPDRPHGFERIRFCLALPDHAVQSQEYGRPFIEGAMNMKLSAFVRIHSFKEIQQLILAGSVELDRNMDVCHAQALHQARLIRQRIARMVVKREIDDDFVAFGRRSPQLIFRGLARCRERSVDSAEIVNAGNFGDCVFHSISLSWYFEIEGDAKSGIDTVASGARMRDDQKVNILGRFIHELMQDAGSDFHALAFH